MATACELGFDRPADDTLLLRLTGSWTLRDDLPTIDALRREIEGASGLRRVSFDAQGLGEWDSGLLTFLVKVVDQCSGADLEADRSGLPEGVRRLLDLAFAVPERKGARREATRDAFLVRLGKSTQSALDGSREMVAFLGSVTVAFGRFLRGKAQYRRSDFVEIIQECGANAFGIVSLISFLVGLILAFMGAVQLRQFGAQIFVADLVGLGMARDMGAMMTAIIMAGRTGAAFAAQLGTMTVNEEVDALTALGISPMEFLVLPRMVALMLMMPLLCLYANLLGILGGFFVGVSMLDITATSYFNQTQAAVTLGDFAGGLVKASIYGAIVAVSGCLRGIQSGRSASAVGAAATSAVVTAIVGIVVAAGLLQVIYDVLGI